MRQDLAGVLRDEAEGEPRVVREFAERVAALFETGLPKE